MARRARTETAAKFAPEVSTRPGAKAFAEIAAKSKSFRPAREVLRRVRAVPTIFPHIDWKLEVGGWPIDRLGFVHGPSAQGKSEFVNGLGLSFLRREHMFCLVEPERTTPIPWIEMLFGLYADDPRFLASRPKSYEQADADVERIANAIGEAKVKGRIPVDTTCLFAVDSMGGLVPEDLIEKMKRAAADSKEGSVDGYNGASGMVQAAMNKAWVRKLVPLMSDTGCSFLGVLREADDRNASPNDRKYGNDWKVLGGRSVIYEGSVVLRVSHAMRIHEDKEDRKSAVVGQRHVVQIYKTKVGAKDDETIWTAFNTSNGAWTPEGFDRARDLLDLGEDLDVIKRGGAWIAFGGKRFQGERRFLQGSTPEYLDALEAACRAKFSADVAKRSDIVGGA